MAFTSFDFKRKWTNPADFPTIEDDEVKVREDMQALHNEIRDALNGLIAELEAADAASRIGADTDGEGKVTSVRDVLDQFAEVLKKYEEREDNSFSVKNISVDNETAYKYGVDDSVVAPSLHHVLEVLLDTRPLLELEQYMNYWWARRVSATTYEPVVGEQITLNPGTSDNTDAYNDGLLFFHVPWSTEQTVDVTYADSVVVDISGALQMVEPQTVTVTSGTAVEDLECVKGKYVENVNKGNILYVPEDAVLGEVRHSSFAWQGYAKTVCKVTVPDLSGREWERIHDTDRNAYPDEGERDGMEYRYLGIPVERLIDMMVEEALREEFPEDATSSVTADAVTPSPQGEGLESEEATAE